MAGRRRSSCLLLTHPLPAWPCSKAPKVDVKLPSGSAGFNGKVDLKVEVPKVDIKGCVAARGVEGGAATRDRDMWGWRESEQALPASSMLTHTLPAWPCSKAPQIDVKLPSSEAKSGGGLFGLFAGGKVDVDVSVPDVSIKG